MTSRDRQADRRTVFDRDAHTCRRCETVGDADDPTALRTYPVGEVPLEGPVHESALVTVCIDCFETLKTSSDSATPSNGAPSSAQRAPFELVRETTRTQGETIADAASFASLATSLPTRLADADVDADAADETAVEYRTGRRDVLLALDVADGHLERLAAIDPAAFDADVRPALATFSETATDLQSTLRGVVELAETVAAAVGRCHGCFAPLEDDSCERCGLELRGTADWRNDDDRLAFDRLFSAINDGLQDASTTTETLTDRTTTVAEQLTE